MIIRKIIKIAATRCHILKLKCTKFDFGWGSAPDLAGGAYSTPPEPLAGFKGPLFLSGGKGGNVGEGRTREGTGRRPEGRGGWREGKGRRGAKGRGSEGRRMDIAHPLFLA